MHASEANDEITLASHALAESLDSSKDPNACAEGQAASEKDQPLDADLVDKIVRQVNFYFSDANLPSDNFLLREVRRTPEGWVPVRLIASFKKMKALTKDTKLIVAALETSEELVVSGHRVRRKDLLPDVDFTDVLLRTAIVDNLPDKASIDSLTEKFSSVGQVNMVRICQPNSGPRSVAQSIPGADLAVSRQQHALIEFATQDAVAAAVQQLTDNDNWRSGLRVRPLLRTAFNPQQQSQSKATSKHQRAQHKQPVKQQQTSAEQQTEPHQQQHQLQQQQAQQGSEAHGVHEAPHSLSDQQHAGSIGDRAQAQTPETDAGQQQPTAAQANSDVSDQSDVEHAGAAKGQSQADQGPHKAKTAARKGQKGKKTKKDYAAWAGATAESRTIASAHLEGNPDAVDTTLKEQRRPVRQGQPSAPGSVQPKMPDGSRGFSMGRGRPILI